MRILTKREEHIFNVAFECICRVVAVTYTTDKLHEIKTQNKETKQLTAIPVAIIDLFDKAGIVKMQTLFCSMNKKTTIPLLIKKLFKDGVQPNRYIFDGLLVIQPIKVQEFTYTHAYTKVSA